MRNFNINTAIVKMEFFHIDAIYRNMYKVIEQFYIRHI